MSTNSINTSSAAAMPPFCTTHYHEDILTCKFASLRRTISDNSKQIYMQIFSMMKKQRRSRPHCSSKQNIFSVALLFFVFVSLVPSSEADFLCGSRLVDALRYICGDRGIHSPSQNSRFRGSSRRHYNEVPRMPVTQRCCEIGCTVTQLKGYCGPKHPRSSRRHYRVHRRHFPTPPAFVIPPSPSLYQRITTKALKAVTTREIATSSEVTTTAMSLSRKKLQSSLKQLKSRYQFLLKEDERDRDVAAMPIRISRSHEIIQLAAELSRRMDRDSLKIISPPDGSQVKATLVLRSPTKQ